MLSIYNNLHLDIILQDKKTKPVSFYKRLGLSSIIYTRYYPVILFIDNNNNYEPSEKKLGEEKTFKKAAKQLERPFTRPETN
jgi:hypothetical protein